MPPSSPLHVGCVICKCTDSCSRSPSFDSAVGVINGSANCDSSQTRWEQLCQPISTLSFSLFSHCGLLSPSFSLSLSDTYAHIVGYLLRHSLRPLQTHAQKLTLKHLGSSPSGWPVHCYPVIFLLLSFLFSTKPCSNISALWPCLPPQAYLSL